MKRTTKIIAATVLSIGVVGTGVAAWKGDGWRRGDHMISHISSELDLNEQQSQALESLRDELWDIKQTIRSNREDHMESVLGVIQGNTLDQGQALSLVSEKTDLVNQYAPQVISSLAAFYDGLDEQQQAKVRKHIAERRNHRGWHH